MVINKNGQNFISFKKFEMLYKIEVNSMFMTKKEFEEMLKDEEHNLGNEVIKKHIILYGEEYFWELIWKNGI
jgi:hypothetical protein